MRTSAQISAALQALAVKARSIVAEIKPVLAKAEDGTITAGERERLENLNKSVSKIRAEETELKNDLLRLYTTGQLAGENGDGAQDNVVASPFGGQGSQHPWTSAVLAALGGKTLRERGTHSVALPVIGPILNAWPTDPLRETDADKMPHATPRRVRFVHELLATRTITEDGVSYLRQTTRTNNAAPTARHGVKPTSIYEMARVTDRARTIAHVSEPIAVQDMADNANLDNFIESELVHGLMLGLDAEVVAGDGTGESMSGLLTVITAEEAFDTSFVKTARKAITTLEEAEVEPNAFVMTPAQWESLETLQTADGEFILPDNKNPVNRARRTLWGVPVAVSNSTTAVLLGDFSGARLAVRENATIDWATAGTVFDDPEYHDLFDANQVKARCELRAVLEVTSTPKFLKVATS